MVKARSLKKVLQIEKWIYELQEKNLNPEVLRYQAPSYLHGNRITLRVTERSVTEMGREGMNSSTHILDSCNAREEELLWFQN